MRGAVLVDALDPADERAAHALEAGLLADLADHRLGQQLAALDPAAGDRPLPRRRPVAPPDQQQAAVVDGDARRRRARGARSSRILRRLGSQPTVHERCARAVRPKRSKKFLVARLPGSGERVDAGAPVLARTTRRAGPSSPRRRRRPRRLGLDVEVVDDAERSGRRRRRLAGGRRRSRRRTSSMVPDQHAGGRRRSSCRCERRRRAARPRPRGQGPQLAAALACAARRWPRRASSARSVAGRRSVAAAGGSPSPIRPTAAGRSCSGSSCGPRGRPRSRGRPRARRSTGRSSRGTTCDADEAVVVGDGRASLGSDRADVDPSGPPATAGRRRRRRSPAVGGVGPSATGRGADGVGSTARRRLASVVAAASGASQGLEHADDLRLRSG